MHGASPQFSDERNPVYKNILLVNWITCQ